MKKQATENGEKIDNKVLSGRVLFLIMQRSGFYLKDFAVALRNYKSQHGGKMCTTPVTLQRALGRRALPDVYSTVLKQLVGRDVYQKWLEIVFKDRPDLFSEATIL